ncbi:MAG: LysM peptidoglycan-binding domain-containing protein [Treponema sp.]|jgi:hypothetical protein|nr:LysM peptidoglycan-binding domain-containing protein [Treponema sp.]
MKKCVLIFAILCLSLGSLSLGAESYTNNEYQKLAREYSQKAQEAFDEGDYTLSIEYAGLAEENAALSQAYIQKMLVKAEADRRLRHAGRRIAWAESVNAPQRFPALFDDASYCYETALACHTEEDYKGAIDYAQLAIDALQSVTALPSLPQYYVVQPWPDTRDCLWNIAAQPFVYNDPHLWRNLYEANKASMPNPRNPNLIHPGMKLVIPRIAEEVREGVYDPKVSNYGVFGE